MSFFLPFRKRVIEEYPKLFGGGDSGDAYGESQQFNQQWGWYNSLYALSKGDIRRFDEVARLRIAEAFTFLTYESQKQEIENNMMRKQFKK